MTEEKNFKIALEKMISAPLSFNHFIPLMFPSTFVTLFPSLGGYLLGITQWKKFCKTQGCH